MSVGVRGDSRSTGGLPRRDDGRLHDCMTGPACPMSRGSGLGADNRRAAGDLARVLDVTPKPPATVGGSEPIRACKAGGISL